jgi:hypothetical protein
MATYEDIYGKRVKEFDSDPTLESSYEGQVWYDKSSGVLKSVVAIEAWSSTSNLATARVYAGSTGIQTAAMIFGGFTPPKIATTEEYNGSGFSAGGDMNTATRSQGSAGTLTAGLSIGGNTNLTKVEEYNGTSWSEVNDVPAGIENNGGLGIQTAAISYGGGAGGANSTTTLEYDGTNWTSGGALNTPRSHAEGSGTQTAGLVFTGDPGFSSGGASATESYNGSSWTTLANVNTARTDAAGGGSQTLAIVLGGRSSAPTNTQATETWDGTAWSTSPATMANTSSNGIGSANQPGSATANISMGGSAAPGSPQVATAEEYNKSANVITAAAFASGGNLPASWYGVGASQFGTQDNGLSFAGNNPGAYVGNTASFLYNGSSWTATPSMSTARAYLSGFGTATSAVGAGGATGPGAKVTSTEEFDGSSWTNGGALNTARGQLASAGASETSGVVFGGAEPSASNKTEEYDGSSWTAGNTMPTSTADPGGNGIQTSAIMVGGNTGPATVTLEYDGTNWASGGSTAVDHKRGGVLAADNTSAIVCGGHSSPQTAVEGYDGTSWSSRPSMSTSRGRMANVGTAASGFVAGGNPSATNATEEWTGETETVTSKTLTTS